MTETIALLGSNLASPPVVAFAAGITAVLTRSDLRFPDQVYQALTIYLLLGIGFKGGSAIATAGLGQLALPLVATIVVGALIPLAAFFVLRGLLSMKVADAAAIAAHYGSVSAVTFMACLAFLEGRGVEYESFMPALMAVMEIPAILVALLLARKFDDKNSGTFGKALHEVLSGKSFVLLICGLVAGALAGSDGRELMRPFLVAPFYGVLMLFLLEMGLVAGERLRDVRRAGLPLVAFALLAPVVQGVLGLLVAAAIGLSQGGGVVFATLTASASYIAAPAAVRVSLPEANPGYYVTTSLGITFPFNLMIGIPLFFSLSGLLWA